MKKIVLFATCIISCVTIYAQQSFDDAIAFETDPAKKFSLYIPSSFDIAGTNKLMVAFHPFNMGTWNAKTWRDELIDFAEEVGVILLCPDGGSDGRIDDPIDYRFTTALIDSANEWYNIDAKGIFAMGFSVGGKAMYEYGLENADVFSGFIPIGAAINGTSEVSDVLSNALCKPFYIIHGENDAPEVRYEPIKTALIQNKAMVEYILMAGVGHTINFPNRESVLKTAFNWIDTVTCQFSTGISEIQENTVFQLSPTVLSAANGRLMVNMALEKPEELRIEIISLNGKQVFVEQKNYSANRKTISVEGYASGIYLINIRSQKYSFSQKFVVN